jgi:2-enoate reductase
LTDFIRINYIDGHWFFAETRSSMSVWQEEEMKLFEPGKIGKMEVKNRIVMAAMGTRGLCELDGRISQRGIDYYVARARGGTGLITTGAITFHVVESHLADGLWSFRPRVDHVVYLARLNELADAVHHYGARIAAQLSAGFGRVGHLTVSSRPIAPSALPCFWDPHVMTRALTLEEISKLIKAFGDAARILKRAEFDAIELHGHEGYLFDQFKTSLWNKRTDKYGGDLTGRLRFSVEVIEEIRNAVGNDLALIYRYGVKHYLEGGREVEEGKEIAKHLEAAGVDALHVDAGCYDTWHWPHPPVYQPAGCMVDCAEIAKSVVKIPVIAVGKLGNPEMAERVLAEEKADFIALGRPLLADPDWPQKVRQRKTQDIRPCIGDHDGCHHRIVNQALTLSCTVNPQVGMEREYTLVPAEKPKRVLIIGGGPGGLEAARVAALRGHQVTLWEKSSRLGGNLFPGSVPDFKQDVRGLINYFTAQIQKLKVDVILNREATAESVSKMHPEVVIVATGGIPSVPEIPGIEGRNVFTAIDLLTGKAHVGDRVTVAGGGVTGCEVAVHLAKNGKRVTITEMMDQLVPGDINLANKMMLLEMLNHHGVAVLTGSRLLKITVNHVVVKTRETERQVAGDSVVLALGLISESQLREDLKAAPFEVFAVGDCVKPRRILNAIWEGFHTSRLI